MRRVHVHLDDAAASVLPSRPFACGVTPAQAGPPTPQLRVAGDAARHAVEVLTANGVDPSQAIMNPLASVEKLMKPK